MVTIPATDFTFEEYLTYDDGTGFHYELVDGRLELIHPPNIEHFLVADFLDAVINTEIKRLSLEDV
jgi:Uma2 family endonuclease